MHEIAELADECTVFRNGRSVATYAGRHEERRRGRRADDRPRVQRRLPGPAPRPRDSDARRGSSVRHLRLDRPARTTSRCACTPAR